MRKITRKRNLKTITTYEGAAKRINAANSESSRQNKCKETLIDLYKHLFLFLIDWAYKFLFHNYLGTTSPKPVTRDKER